MYILAFDFKSCTCQVYVCCSGLSSFVQEFRQQKNALPDTMMTYLGKNHRETYSNPPLVVTDLILVIGVRWPVAYCYIIFS